MIYSLQRMDGSYISDKYTDAWDATNAMDYKNAEDKLEEKRREESAKLQEATQQTVDRIKSGELKMEDLF